MLKNNDEKVIERKLSTEYIVHLCTMYIFVHRNMEVHFVNLCTILVYS